MVCSVTKKYLHQSPRTNCFHILYYHNDASISYLVHILYSFFFDCSLLAFQFIGYNNVGVYLIPNLKSQNCSSKQPLGRSNLKMATIYKNLEETLES